MPEIGDWRAAALLAAGVVELEGAHGVHLVRGPSGLDVERARQIVREAENRGIYIDREDAESMALDLLGTLAAREAAHEATGAVA